MAFILPVGTVQYMYQCRESGSGSRSDFLRVSDPGKSSGLTRSGSDHNYFKCQKMLRKCLLIIKKESTNGYHYKVTFHCIFCKIKAKESKILICYLYFLFFCLDPYPKQTIPHPTGSGIRITTLNCILHNPY